MDTGTTRYKLFTLPVYSAALEAGLLLFLKGRNNTILPAISSP